MANFTLRVESSILPPFTIDETAIGLGEPDSTGQESFDLSEMLKSVVRPKATYSTPFGSGTSAPYGEPFPWPVGLILLTLGVFYIIGAVIKALRSAT